jgi:hypothetical protein
MKFDRLIVAALAPMLLMTGCDNIFGLDNFDEPNAVLTGRVVYQGQPLQLRSGGVELDLLQPGYELSTRIPVYVDQDGTFSASVFNGTYKLIPRAGNGPWLNTTDTITVNVSGTTAVDVPVTPYYTVQNQQVSFSASPLSITGTMTVGSVNTTRAVEWVALYVGTTAFADRTNRIAFVERPRAQIPNLTSPISITVNLPANIHVTQSPERRDHVYVRMGIKTVGVAEMIFGPLVKVAI